MVVKSTQFVGKTLLLTVTGELLPTAVDNTVSINGELYRVAQITDIITEESRMTRIVREIKVVSKVSSNASCKRLICIFLSITIVTRVINPINKASNNTAETNTLLIVHNVTITTGNIATNNPTIIEIAIHLVTIKSLLSLF